MYKYTYKREYFLIFYLKIGLQGYAKINSRIH